MQRTNSEYGSPYLATHHFPFLSLSLTDENYHNLHGGRIIVLLYTTIQKLGRIYVTAAPDVHKLSELVSVFSFAL